VSDKIKWSYKELEMIVSGMKIEISDLKKENDLLVKEMVSLMTHHNRRCEYIWIKGVGFFGDCTCGLDDLLKQRIRE